VNNKVVMGRISRKRKVFYFVLVLVIMGIEMVLHPTRRDMAFMIMGYGVVNTGWRTIKEKKGMGETVLSLGLWAAISFFVWLMLYLRIGTGYYY